MRGPACRMRKRSSPILRNNIALYCIPLLYQKKRKNHEDIPEFMNGNSPSYMPPETFELEVAFEHGGNLPSRKRCRLKEACQCNNACGAWERAETLEHPDLDVLSAIKGVFRKSSEFLTRPLRSMTAWSMLWRKLHKLKNDHLCRDTKRNIWTLEFRSKIAEMIFELLRWHDDVENMKRADNFSRQIYFWKPVRYKRRNRWE